MREKRFKKNDSLPLQRKVPGKTCGRRRNRVLLFLSGILFVAALSVLLTGCASGKEGEEDGGTGRSGHEDVPDTSAESYGVFLGVDKDNFSIDLFEGYDMVVVDAQELRSEQLAQLHATGHTVYSYLNVGSIEDSRDYYEQFEDIMLARYKNWPEENWIDVTREEWQEFVTGDLPDRIYDRDPKTDGLFLDNFDIYYYLTGSLKYREKGEAAYEALVRILQAYREKEIPVLVNGAEVFVQRLLEEGKETLIQGVNQETVFTRIKNYRKDRFDEQDEEETEYYTDYLQACSDAGLQVFLLEYTDDVSVEARIEQYCREQGYRYYISDHVNLIPSEE